MTPPEADFSLGQYPFGRGTFPCAEDPAHLLCLHVSAPIEVVYTQGRHRSRSVQMRGHLNLLPAGTACTWETSDPATLLFLKINPGYLQTIAAETGLRQADAPLTFGRLLHFRDDAVKHLLWSLASEINGDNVGGRLVTDCLCATLAVLLLRRCTAGKAGIGGEGKGGLSPRALHCATEFMHESLRENVRLADVALAAGVSVSHFKEAFKQSTGVSPYHYLLQCRIERARHLLVNTDRTIANIAKETGFADQSHLTRHLRRATGLTPKQFRTR